MPGSRPTPAAGSGAACGGALLPEEAWVRLPSDWSPRTQTGATYDLSTGEGRQVWQECLAAAALDARELAPVRAPAASTRRYGAQFLHCPRLGQGIFRVQVLDAYGRACAVTGEHSLPVLEAAHIKPYANGGEHDVANGLALRSDIHRLCDKGYVTVDEDTKFVVGRRFTQDFENGALLLWPPRAGPAAPAGDRPAPVQHGACLPHREQVFLG